jgi:archaeal flagellar protein FlaI
MKTQGLRDYISVATLFHAYNIDPANVLAHIADLRQVIQ